MTTEDSSTINAKNGHAQCLLCGDQNPWSLKLCFQAGDDGVIKARFQAHSALQGYDDVLHGGVIAALLDAAMTHCLFHHGVQAVTGDLHVRFVQPVSCNATLEIHAWMLSSTPPVYRSRAEIIHEKRVMAWAEAKFMQRRSLRASLQG